MKLKIYEVLEKLFVKEEILEEYKLAKNFRPLSLHVLSELHKDIITAASDVLDEER